ncbi:MAG: rhomboid family intramembrane serine protease [Gammaproteobacteria bacterium]|nr:rhomboid family intramembrane serine protease [Gammaproteobacteria bacterium]MDH5651642.1 rhomboid family intramembrane serine protease [Gammaproteobacteria bacterium]
MFPLYDDNPTSRFPLLTILLIVSCVLVFLWQLSLGSAMHAAIRVLGATPAVLFGNVTPTSAAIPPWTTAITSMFLHGGWMHLIGNMLYLWIFGNNIEDAMGRTRFIIFYVLCGLAALLANALPDTDSTIPMIGASGAISGVLGAYLLLYPQARVLVAIPFGFIIHTTRLAAVWVLGFWFVLQIINSLLTAGQEGGVAWGAHIGGFVAGVVLVPFFKRKEVPFFAPRRE